MPEANLGTSTFANRTVATGRDTLHDATELRLPTMRLDALKEARTS